MSGRAALLIELVLVFGGVLAWACWELVSLRRSQAKDLAERARHAEGEHGPHEG